MSVFDDDDGWDPSCGQSTATLKTKRSSVGSVRSNKSARSYKSARSSFNKTRTMNERQMMHPLEREDPIAYKFIRFVRLG